MVFNIVQHRRGSEVLWKKLNPIPADGELIIVEFEDGLRKFKLGDGKSVFTLLPYLDDSLNKELSTIETLLESSEKSLAELYSIQENYAQILEVLSQNLEQTNTITTEALANVTNEFTNADKTTLAQAKEYAVTKISKVEQNLLNITKQTNELNQQVTDLEDSIAINSNQLAELFAKSNSFENIDTELKKSLDDLKSKHTELSNVLETTVSQINQQIASLSVTSTNSIRQLKTEFESTINNQTIKLDNTITDVEALKNFENQQNIEVTTLKADLNEIVQDLNILSENTEATHKQLATSLANEVAARQSTSKELSDKITTSYDQITSNFGQEIATLSIDFNTKYEQLDTKLDTEINVLKIFDENLASRIEKLSSHINAQIQLINLINQKQDTTISDLAAGVAQNNEQLSEQLNTFIKDCTTQQALLTEDIEKETSNRINVDEELTKRLDNITASFGTQLQSLNLTDLAQAARLSDLTEEVNKNNLNISEQLTELSTEFTNRINQLNTNLNDETIIRTTNIENLSAQIQELVTRIDSQNQQIALIDINQNSQINDLYKNLNLTIDDINKISNKLDVEIEKEILALNKSIELEVKDREAADTEILAKLNSYVEIFNTYIQNIGQQQNSFSTDVNSLISDCITRLTEIESKQTEFDSSTTELKSTTDDLKQSVDTIQNQFQSLKDTVDNLAQKTDSIIKANLPALALEITKNNASILDLTSQVAQTKNEQLQINANVANTLESQEKQLKTLNDNSVSQASDISNIKTELESINKDTAFLQAVNEFQSTNIITLNSSIQDLRNNVASADTVNQLSGKITELEETLPNLVPKNMVDNLQYEPASAKVFLASEGNKIGDGVPLANDLFYDIENSLLYITSNGERLNDGIFIASGGGEGGGGGNTSSSILTLTNLVKDANGIITENLTAAINKEVIIEFDFKSIRNEKPTGNGSCSITVNSKEVHFSRIAQGYNSFNIAQWLLPGFNNVSIKCTDKWGNYDIVDYVVNVITLSVIISNFQQYHIYDNYVSFDYKVVSELASTDAISFYRSIEYVNSAGNTVTAVDTLALTAGQIGTTNAYNIPFSDLAHGNNLIKLWARTDLYDLSSEEQVFNILVTKENNTDSSKSLRPMLWSSCNVTEIDEGEQINIPFKLYHPKIQEAQTIMLIIKDAEGIEYFSEIKTDVTSLWNPADHNDFTWHVSNYPTGDVEFIIKYNYSLNGTPDSISNSHKIKINEFKAVEPVSSGLELYLAAAGRSNQEERRDIWEYTYAEEGKEPETFSTTFNKFNWVSNGWINDGKETCLRLNGDASIEINYKPFKNSIGFNGKTIELEFAIRDVNTRNTPVISCMSESKGAIIVSYVEDTNEAVIPEGDGSRESPFIFTGNGKKDVIFGAGKTYFVKVPNNYTISLAGNGLINDKTSIVAEEDKIYEIVSGEGTGFVATADSLYLRDTQALRCAYREDQKTRVSFVIDGNKTSPFITMYLDGILTAVTQKNERDTFLQQPASNILIGSSTCGIDIYSIRCYNRALTHEEIKNNFISDQTDLTIKKDLLQDNAIYNSDDDKKYYRNIDYLKVKQRIPTITLIGTLPAYKGDKKKGTVRMIFEHPDAQKIYGTESTVVLDTMLNQLDVQGTSSKDYPRKNWKLKLDNAISLIPGELAAKVFCIKVDYAESTGTHNTQNANFIESLYSEELPVQKLLNANFDDIDIDKVETFKEDLEKIRTTIAGFPIVVFHLPYTTEALKDLSLAEINENTDVKFYSKGNLNFDKGAEQVFAFNLKDPTGKLINTECWEFKENMDPEMFRVPWEAFETEPENFFEARYHPNLAEYEDLLDPSKEKYDPVAAKQLFKEHMIAPNFKKMYDWVYSTARGKNSKNENYATGVELSENRPDWAKAYTHDTDDYRLAKFTNEFSKYFDLHYTLVYYLYTFFALMVDQRAKNMFLTYWEDRDDSGNILVDSDNKATGKWYPYFYDNDTCFGIDNVGQLKFDYYHEDSGEAGKIATADIFNGQNSVLWCNFREAFKPAIKALYQTMRGESKITYEKLINAFITNGSDTWSESIYNEDAYYKYVSIATNESDYDPDGDGQITITAAHLGKARGSGEQHLKYFLKNRLDYCDSKWDALSYRSDSISFRAYQPTKVDNPIPGSEEEKSNNSIDVVAPSLKIEIIPYSTHYFAVKYGSSNELKDEQLIRLQAGQLYMFDAENNNAANDLDTYIMGASHISEICDLAPLYPGFVSVDKAIKLKKLKIGDGRKGYCNLNLGKGEQKVSLGQNKLLQEIDVQNCPNLTGDLALSGCTSLSKVLARGSSISGLTLYKAAVAGSETTEAQPAEYGSSYLTHVELPSTITFLTLNNQLLLTNDGLILEGIDKLTDVSITNCLNFNTNNLLEELTNTSNGFINDIPEYTVKHLKLDNLKIGFRDFDLDGNMLDAVGVTISYMRKFDNIYGYDAGEQINPAQLFGDCYLIPELSEDAVDGNAFVELAERYKNKLTFRYDKMKSVISFYHEDGTPFEYNGQNYTQEIIAGMPGTKDTSGNIITRDAVDPVECGYFEIPTKPEDDQFTYEFDGWTTWPGTAAEADALCKIEADRSVYPAFKAIIKQYPVNFINSTIKDETKQILCTVNVDYGTTEVKYPKNEAEIVKSDVNDPKLYEFIGWIPKPENITGELNCYAQFAIADNIWYTITLTDIVENTDAVGGGVLDPSYKLDTVNQKITVLACGNDLNAAVRIPEELEVEGINYKVISIAGFKAHKNLELLNLQEGLQIIGASGFAECTNLIEVKFPESLTTIGQAAFENCSKLKSIHIPSKVTSIAQQAFNACTNLVQITVAPENSKFIVENNCLIELSGTSSKKLLKGLDSSRIPESITSFEKYCFANTNITEAIIPEGITSIPDNAFSRCKQLKTVSLPSTTEELLATCFAWCSELSEIAFPSNLKRIKTYIFASCPLMTLDFPASLEEISEMAFGDISSLQTVKFNSIPKIDKGAFRNSGSADGITFYVPWTDAEADADMRNDFKLGIGYSCSTYKQFVEESTETVIVNGKEQPKYLITDWYWGIKDKDNITIHYNYKEEGNI